MRYAIIVSSGLCVYVRFCVCMCLSVCVGVLGLWVCCVTCVGVFSVCPRLNWTMVGGLMGFIILFYESRTDPHSVVLLEGHSNCAYNTLEVHRYDVDGITGKVQNSKPSE